MDKSIKAILARNPNRIPIICLPAINSMLKPLDKKKFLVPRDLTFYQFMFVIRSRMDKEDIKNKDALYLYYRDKNNKICVPNSSTIFGYIYDVNMSEDKCLYVYYDKENVFG
jgi:GABA(A) receptor-associated protein